MKLLVGLGNPGKKYNNNRHNVGHMVVGILLATKLPKDVLVKRSSGYMNDSGNYVLELINRYSLKSPHLWVVHDDLDINLGAYKIQKGKGPRLHNGINSIEEKLGRDDFWRVRVGVDNRSPDSKIPGEKYVLEDFTEEELVILNKVIDKVVSDIKDRLSTKP